MKSTPVIGKKAKTAKLEDENLLKLESEFLAMIQKIESIQPNRETWDIEGTWTGAGLIYFVDFRQQSAFEPYRHLKSKRVKIVNYDKPAVKLSFFYKHKYWVSKEENRTQSGSMTPEQKDEYLLSHIDRLNNLRTDLINELTNSDNQLSSLITQKIDDLEKQLKTWTTIYNDRHLFELCASTYDRGYTYLYCSYKFRLESGWYDNTSVHLLNNQHDRKGNIIQKRINVIFIDMQEIFREHPMQNKEIENMLAKYPYRTEGLTVNIYARLKPFLPYTDPSTLPKP